jgi:hypothetical protein
VFSHGKKGLGKKVFFKVTLWQDFGTP